MDEETTLNSENIVSGDASLQTVSPRGKQEVNEETNEIIVGLGRIPSQSESIFIEIGKDLVKGSVPQSIEFHKTMLGLTTSFATLMASAFGILAFGSKDQQLDSFQRLFLAIPVLLMLLSSVSFAMGYYPRSIRIQLKVLSSIEDVRDKLLQTRRNWAVCGILFFVFAILSLIVGIVFLNVH